KKKKSTQQTARLDSPTPPRPPAAATPYPELSPLVGRHCFDRTPPPPSPRSGQNPTLLTSPVENLRRQRISTDDRRARLDRPAGTSRLLPKPLVPRQLIPLRHPRHHPQLLQQPQAIRRIPVLETVPVHETKNIHLEQ